MCGRITQQLSTDQIGELYGVRATPLPPDRLPRYNGAPGQHFIACLVEQHGARALARLRWGLVPSWARDARTGSRLINARAESVHFKPSFRAAFRRRRCRRCSSWRGNPMTTPLKGVPSASATTIRTSCFRCRRAGCFDHRGGGRMDPSSAQIS